MGDEPVAEDQVRALHGQVVDLGGRFVHDLLCLLAALLKEEPRRREVVDARGDARGEICRAAGDRARDEGDEGILLLLAAEDSGTFAPVVLRAATNRAVTTSTWAAAERRGCLAIARIVPPAPADRAAAVAPRDPGGARPRADRAVDVHRGLGLGENVEREIVVGTDTGGEDYLAVPVPALAKSVARGGKERVHLSGCVRASGGCRARAGARARGSREREGGGGGERRWARRCVGGSPTFYGALHVRGGVAAAVRKMAWLGQVSSKCQASCEDWVL